MVEFIGEGVDGAVDRLGDAVAQRKREEGLVADGEGDVLEFAEIIGDLDWS